VALVGHDHVGRASAADPRAADFADAQRVEQDHEPSEVVGVLGLHAHQRHLVLELPQVRSRRDDGGRNAQHVEPQPLVTTRVADLDDVGLANLVERVGELIVLLALLGAHGIQEGVPHFRGELQRLAGLGLFEAVAHSLRSDPQAREVAILVDPLDVGRDWFLDERFGGVVLVVGEANPEVMPALFAGDRDIA
jgi:hypothetical protein